MGALGGEAVRVEPPARVGSVVMEGPEGLDMVEAARTDDGELRLYRRKFPRAVELHGEGHWLASFPFSRPSERPNFVWSERFFVTVAFVGEKRSIGYGQRRRGSGRA